MGKFKGKQIFKIHQWAGLLAGLFIFLMGITGAILVFHHELDQWEHHEVWNVENGLPVSVDRGYQGIISRYQNWDIRLLRFSQNPTETLVFQLRRPDRRLTVFVHPSTGTILKEIDTQKTVVFWLLKLHYALHAKLVGEIIVLLVGIVYLVSLLTGLIVYRRSIFKVLLFQSKFNRKNKRTWASALHRYVGVWALLLNLLVVITGAVISYEVVKSGLKKQAAANVITNLPLKWSVDSALREIALRKDGFRPSYIRFPLQAEGPVTIAGRAGGPSFFYSQFYNTVTLESESGKVGVLELAKDKSTAIQISSLVRGIHFVEFGNFWVKLLFMFVGLSAPLLSITGFFLWKWRKKK